MTRHVWAEYLEEAEENEYTVGVREYYPKRQKTIERCFGLAKELHGFRYTQEYGRARMEVKAALTFACMNRPCKIKCVSYRKRNLCTLFLR